jgi:hypothetical protein
MCQCKFFNGDSCSYYDYASGKTEDGYCSSDGEGENEDGEVCDTFDDEVDEDDEIKEMIEERNARIDMIVDDKELSPGEILRRRIQNKWR